MFGAARVNSDTAGGTHLGGGQDFVKIDGDLWVLKGDSVQNHGSSPHNNATMNEGSSFIKIDGVEVCREQHKATCNHASTGSSFLMISD